MIIISAIAEEANSASLTIDEYVPVSFRTYLGPLGAKYLRIGNFETTLLECLLDQHSNTIRGVTLVSFDKIHAPTVIQVNTEAFGLPVVDVQQSGVPDLLEDSRQAEVECKFSVGLTSDFFEIDLTEIASADRKITCGPAQFFLRNSALVGIRFTSLSSSEISILQKHVFDIQSGGSGVNL